MVGGLIRAAVEKEWKTSSLALQLLFTADRAHHVDTKILPALKEGKIVICDRYFFSTLAYGEISGLDVDWLKEVNSKFPLPNLIIFIDVPSEVSIERISKSRFQATIFEEKEKLEKVRDSFKKLHQEYAGIAVLINGTRGIQEVHEEIKAIVENKLRL